MINQKIDIPNDVIEIFKVINEYGADAYIVGGCVRDSILGKEPHDWDICTPALACELLVMFEEKGYKVIPTGLQHGTITVHMNDTNYEITTFRKDGKYSDGRHPDTVEFTSDIEYDLERRDFTMNAIAYNPEKGFIDPFNGYDDIQNKIVRCVKDPDMRFQEDALRILRALRFAATYLFTIDVATSVAIRRNKKLIHNVSMERINSEFCKLFNSPIKSYIFYNYSDVIAEFIPEISPMIGFQQNNPYHIADVYSHTLMVLDCAGQDLITNLAAFFHDIGKPLCYQEDEDGIGHFKGHGKVSAELTDKIMRRLRFDNDTREKVIQLVYYHDATFEVGKKYVRRWINKLGVDQFRRLLALRKADINGQSAVNINARLEKIDKVKDCLDEVLSEKPAFSIKDLEINGKDVMKYMGINEGVSVGIILNHILSMVIDEKLENNKGDLIQYLKRGSAIIDKFNKIGV